MFRCIRSTVRLNSYIERYLSLIEIDTTRSNTHTRTCADVGARKKRERGTIARDARHGSTEYELD